MANRSEIRLGLTTLIKKYFELLENEQLYSEAGYELYIKILTLKDACEKANISDLYASERVILPELSKLQFTKYFDIVQTERRTTSRLLRIIANFLLGRDLKQTATQRKFEITHNLLKLVYRYITGSEIIGDFNQNHS
ncbi:MAG: hypothetical protein ACPGTP_04140 [Bacteroidia bacterium]